ncbi:hypothetical protein ZTR_06423 [Talaromyces verruculosus]|nr:hypothetical protein ZTR_06423 [Talaromyces verruculosus]
MAYHNHIILFPHEHEDILEAMHDLTVQSKMRPRLRTFLTAALAVLQGQTLTLDAPERARIGLFEDLVDLAERHVNQHRSSASVDIVLSTVVQIGKLVLLAEDHPMSDKTIPIGFGLGLIAAAIAATASNPETVVTLGVEGVRIAFRLSIDLQRTGRDIDDSDGLWAVVVSDFKVAEVDQQLEKVNQNLPPLRRAYVGQVLPDSVVIYGPPSTLDSLAQTSYFAQNLASSSAPSSCPLFGAHFPSVDVARVLGDSSILDISTIKRPLYGAYWDAGNISGGTLRDLLRLAVVGIAHKQVRIEDTFYAAAAALEDMDSLNIVLTTVGSTIDATMVQNLFQKHGKHVRISESVPTPKPSGVDIDGVSPDAIAIVGMSGRFPDSDTLDEFWSLLETGTTTHQEIPLSRFKVDDFYDPSRSKHNALLARYGCFIKKPGEFDHRLFNISPREAMQMDPVQRMLLMTTYEALEMAGYSPGGGEHDPPRIATYFGQTTDDWKTINEQQGIDTHFLPGVNRGFAPGRLSHYFRWSGGFYSIDTGCSSSATALCLARDALIAGEIDAAVVGGGTLLTAPEWFAGLSQGGFLSPTGACKTYSDGADGYCRGEGVAVVVLKRLTDAVLAKDNILAVLAGASRNCNAGAGSITYPGEEAQKALYRRVLRQAGVRPHDIGVVEMHGTGTQAGDRVEMRAVQSVFASQTGFRRAQPLIVGAVKANIGHSEAAAGVVSLIKAILILHRDSIPPQPGLPFTLNPELAPLLGTDIQLANGQLWPRNEATPRYVFVNNFDAAGGNVSMIIHDTPSFALPTPRSQLDIRPHHVVVVSGRTTTALEANKSRLRQYLTQHLDTQLADLAYTTTARRIHHLHRDAYVATSVAELLRQLEQPTPVPVANSSGLSVVFAFTGQGSQYIGMGSALYRTSPTLRGLLDSYQRISNAQGLDCQFLDAILGSEDATSTVNTTTERNLQVATVALEIALARYWITVVGGPIPAIEALENYMKSQDNVATTRLRVQYAFHTRQMDPVLDDLESTASRVPFNSPNIPVASALLGRIVQPGEDAVFNANYLRRHTREPVAFLDAVHACETEGLIQNDSFVVEVGPHPTVIGLMASSLQSARPNSYPSLRRGREDWGSISLCLAAAYRAQIPVRWTQFHSDHLNNLRVLSDLPTYAFDMKSFWFSYKTQTAPNNTSDTIMPNSSLGISRLSSTALHSVEKLQKEKDRLIATFISDLSQHQLADAIGGHVVDDVAICPASIFIDMAYTAAAFLEGESRSTPKASLATYELASLSMHTPLVLREDVEPPRVWVEAILDQSTDVVSVRFFSHVKGASSSTVDYGSCLVRLNQPNTTLTQSWSRMQPLVKARMRTLDEARRPKEVHAMDQQLFYKIFSEIVEYSKPFFAVEEATVAADFHDAAVVLKPVSTTELGNFTCNPFAVDSLVHVPGFLLNADVRKPKKAVHIANYIGSLRVLGDLSSHGPYRAYATIREQDTKAGTSLCDMYVTDCEDKLIALCTDINFKKLERDFFALLTGSSRAHPPKPRPKVNQKQSRTPEKSTDLSDSSAIATPATSLGSPSSLSSAVDLAAELFAVITARSGISAAELKASATTTFTEMGLDSQMAITILTDFRKAVGVELPAAFFSNFPTPAAVEEELGAHQLEDIPAHDLPAKAPSKQSPAETGPSKELLRLVADALDLETSDLTPSTTFESIGMDSMLSIKVISAFHHETGLELPAAFFADHQSVAAAQKELDGPLQTTMPEELATASSPLMEAKFTADAAAKSTHNTTASAASRQHKLESAVSRAVLIQGQSRSRDASLFLTTDGSGTVESYIHLSALPKGRRIYGLESPFLERPEDFDLSIEEMATIFIRTIRRIQPQGPYLIGGWSAGSMYAYEVAHRLTMEGETILALIILDMRAPSLIPTEIVTTDFVDKLGTFEGINRARDLPEDLSVKEKAHLMATCRALSRYDAPAFPVGRQPRHVVVVWARLGLDNRKDAPVAAMGRPGLDIGKPLGAMTLHEFERYFNSWFYGRREQFGTNGWETLLGNHISVHTVDGDHFSMMAPPFSAAVGAIVADAVMQATDS